MVFIETGQKHLQFRHILPKLYRTRLKLFLCRPRRIFIPTTYLHYVQQPTHRTIVSPRGICFSGRGRVAAHGRLKAWIRVGFWGREDSHRGLRPREAGQSPLCNPARQWTSWDLSGNGICFLFFFAEAKTNTQTPETNTQTPETNTKVRTTENENGTNTVQIQRQKRSVHRN